MKFDRVEIQSAKGHSITCGECFRVVGGSELLVMFYVEMGGTGWQSYRCSACASRILKEDIATNSEILKSLGKSTDVLL